MSNVRNILDAYYINPTEITPITKRLYKIQSHQYTFALKQAKLDVNQLERWKSIYYFANEKQLASILSVYLTQQGEIYYQEKDAIYYLTPWITKKENDEPKHEIESFYHAIATVHHQTKQQQTIHVDALEQMIQQEKEKLAYYRDKLLGYVEKFEQRHYMSPFELRVCMQYRDLQQVFKQLDDWYDYYLEDVSEDNTTYLSLCHGNLRASHKLYQNNFTYLINWERSYFGTPVSDLASYFYHELQYHDSQLDQIINSFPIYERYNPLAQAERSLLAIYLLTPYHYFQVIEKYESRNWKRAQPFQIRALEYSYRRLMYGLTMQNHLYQIREQLQEQAEQADNPQEED